MRRLERRYGDTGFWDRTVYFSLPRETREYVPRVFAAAWLFLHPEEFNLEFPAYDTETTELTLEREASIGELADLNRIRPPRYTIRVGQQLKIPGCP